MPSRTSQNTTGAGSKQCEWSMALSAKEQQLTGFQDVKPPTKAAKSGLSKKETLVERTRHDYDAQRLKHEQPSHQGEKRYSAAVNRWLEEPVAEGPYNGIAGVVGWERYSVDDGGSTDRGERKKRDKGKKDKRR